MTPFIKKCIISGFCFFFVFSIFELIVTQDSDFFLDYLGIKVIFSIIFSLLFTLRYGTNYSSTKSEPPKPPIVIHENFDVKEINFNLFGYNSDWFDCDVFKGNSYSIGVEFHSDYFDKSCLPADFYADKKLESEKVKKEVWHDWYYIELDHHAAGHGHDFPENRDLEDFIYHNNKVIGIYECTYKVKNYKTLMEVCAETASLSVRPKLTKKVCFCKEHLKDFTEKVSNMPLISMELKQYFLTDFINDLTILKTKEDKRTASKVTHYDSKLIIKNAGKEIFEAKLFSFNPNIVYISSFLLY